MRSSEQLDPTVRALADIEGEDFASTRIVVLERIRDVAGQMIRKGRRSVPRIGVPDTAIVLYDVDPGLYAWFMTSYAISSVAPSVVGKFSIENKATIDATRGYLERIMSAFSMRKEAASKTINEALIDASETYAGYVGIAGVSYSVNPATAFSLTNRVARLCQACLRMPVRRYTDRGDVRRRAWDIVTSTVYCAGEQCLDDALESILAYPPNPSQNSGALRAGISSLGAFAVGAAAGAIAKRLASPLK